MPWPRIRRWPRSRKTLASGAPSTRWASAILHLPPRESWLSVVEFAPRERWDLVKSFCPLSCARQQHPKSRTLAGCTPQTDRSGMGSYNSLNEGEAKATAGAFGSKE
jgi:hypothetical protein